MQEKRPQKAQKDFQALEESSAPKPKRVPESKQESKQEKPQATQSLAAESSTPTKETKDPAMHKNADLPQDKETNQDSKNPLQKAKSTQKQKNTQTNATKESTQDSKSTKTQTTQNKKPKNAQEIANTTQTSPQKSVEASTNSAQTPNEEQIQMDSISQQETSQKEALLANILESSENKASLANKELAKSKEQMPKPNKTQNDESKESHKASEPKMQDSKQGGNPRQGSQQQNAQTMQSVQNEFEQVQDSANKEFLESLLELQSVEEHKSTKPSVKEKTAIKESSAQNAQTTQNMQPTRTHTITPFAYRTALARESVRNFATNLYQEIQNYKPPLTKITLELNPQNLGTLEVSISKKGKDLHVQVHSNQQAIALFMQNQTDLRTNLAQIGFENVDLSFSESGGGNAKQGQHNQDSNLARNENGLENDDTDANMPNIMYLRIPRYA